MKTRNLIGVTFLAGLLLLPVAARAQSSTSGGIAGTARDTTGAVLPGVTVEAASPALIEKVRTVVTDDHGEYKILDLRPGAYAVTFTLTGFNTVKREGLTLSAGVTLPVSADMKVGSLAETITVSGASPVVDVQNARTQNVLTQEILNAVPSSKTLSSLSALTVGVVAGGSAIGSRDVGGSAGDFAVISQSHHGSASDGAFRLDGMNQVGLMSNGASRRSQFNQAFVQETVYQTSGMSAEVETGGVDVNLIPKDGGNRFSGTVNGEYTGKNLQSSNFDSKLQARGLTRVGPTIRVYDASGGVGGPLKKDKVWFFTSTRKTNARQELAGSYFNATQGTLFYTPDLSKPAYQDNPLNDYNSTRLTWQATTKQKVAFTFNKQFMCFCYLAVGPARSPEGSWSGTFPETTVQGTWSYPVTNRLMFSAGAQWRQDNNQPIRAENVGLNDRSIVNQATGLTYGSFVSGNNPALFNVNGWLNDYGVSVSHFYETRAQVTYVTGSHAFKAGYMSKSGFQDYGPGIPNFAEQYTFSGTTPIGLTELAAPGFATTNLKVNLGVYAQDQWTVRRFTINAGVRLDYLNAYSPAQTRPAGAYTPEFTFGAVQNTPNWKDVSPRLGIAWDIFGNGKTAVKGSLGRYVQSQATQIAQNTNPSNAIAGTAFRTWGDANGNYVPDCNLKSPAANGECGALSNQLFGTTVFTSTYDPAIINCSNCRPNVWEGSAGIQQEIRPGFGVNVTYFHTSLGNFQVSNNAAVSASDYSQYCITAPSFAMLPGGGGNQVCGMSDIKPTAFGKVQTVVTSAENFGAISQVYNGVDITATAKWGKGGLVTGGASLGRTVNNDCALNAFPQVAPVQGGFNHSSPSASTGFCTITNPQYQVKGAVSYPLPWWGLQVSGVLQNLMGAPWAASYSATNALISPSLGRNLGQCGVAATCNGTATIPNLFAPTTRFEPRQTQVDFRLSKTVRVRSLQIRPKFDIFNLLNANDLQVMNTRYAGTGSTWLNGVVVLPGRLFKFGASIDF